MAELSRTYPTLTKITKSLLAKTTGKNGISKVKGIPSSAMLLATLQQVIIASAVRCSIFFFLVRVADTLRLNCCSAENLLALCQQIEAFRLALLDDISPHNEARYLELTRAWLNCYCTLAKQYSFAVTVRISCHSLHT